MNILSVYGSMNDQSVSLYLNKELMIEEFEQTEPRTGSIFLWMISALIGRIITL